MADGNGYGANANQAASHAKQCSANGCPKCDKQGLPVLLTIPTLAERDYATGLGNTIKPLLTGTADPSLSHAGYVTRGLRDGYVMAYYEKPPADLAVEDGHWTVAKVDFGGMMTPTTFAALGVGSDKSKARPKNSPPFSCSRAGGYAAAMLFVIPNAKKAGKVWVAFSSHPWSPGVRQKYANGGDDFRQKYMTLIHADSASCNRSIKLTDVNLRHAVPDCLPNFNFSPMAGNPYLPPHMLHPVVISVSKSKGTKSFDNTSMTVTDLLLSEANKALGKDGEFTIDDAMIVGLPDPEGVTATAAQRRITLCNRAADWVQAFKDDLGQQNGHWRLQSALTVQGLFKIFEGQAEKGKTELHRYDAWRGKSIQKKDFQEKRASGELPKDASWKLSPLHPPRIPVGDYSWGTVELPTDKRIDDELQDQIDDIKKRLSATAQGMDWADFLNHYNNLAKSDAALLATVEQDHKAWLQCDLFEHHHTHNFDDADPRDGVPYAGYVSQCLMGGPITKDALAWWKEFLSDDPSAKSNLLMRAMLGNQKKYFDWISSTDTQATVYDEARGLLDVAVAARENGGHASDKQAEGFAQSLLGTAGALAARMDEAKTLSATLRDRLKRLGLGLIARSESNVFLYKLRVPVGIAGKLWRNMAGAARVVTHKAAETGGRRIKSLVLGGTMALELEGSPKAAQALVDVYLWSRGEVKVKIGKVDGKFKLTTTEVLGDGQVAFATGLTEETAVALSKSSMRLLRGAGSGLLSAGSGFLQVLVLGEAREQFEHGTKEDQRAAAVTLLTSGIGIGAAFMEISGMLARQFEKQSLEKGLKMLAARALAVATAIGAVQSALSGYSAMNDGDDDAAAMYYLQSVFFAGAAGAGFMAASAIGAGAETTAVSVGTVSLGLSWTGIGLILVALGVLTGFVILILKDTPLEAWAAESVWGKASAKYPNLAREQEALNEALIGAEVNFSYGVFAEGTFWSNFLSNVGASQYNRGAALTGQPLMAQTMEAQLRLIVPKVVIERQPWLLEIHASRRGQGVVKVAYWNSTGAVSSEGDNATLGQYEAIHEQEDMPGNDKITSLNLSVRLDTSQYCDAFAIVRVADGSTDTRDVLVGHGSYIIQYERLGG